MLTIIVDRPQSAGGRPGAGPGGAGHADGRAGGRQEDQSPGHGRQHHRGGELHLQERKTLPHPPRTTAQPRLRPRSNHKVSPLSE